MPLWGSAPGLLVLFFCQVRAEAAAGFSQSRIAYILELKIHGGSNLPVCTADGGPHARAHTHTYTVGSASTYCTHTRACPQYILTYILLKYICYVQYISIST